MYDRETESLWNQLTGEPVIGPLANSGIKLDFFPVLLTTWQEWVDEHPDTTVLSIYTDIYPPDLYLPESDPASSYYDYRNRPGPLFPIWNIGPQMKAKDLVLGLNIGESYKAYPVRTLQTDLVVNDQVGNVKVVIVTPTQSQAIRVYERGHYTFSLPSHSVLKNTSTLQDSSGETWNITEAALIHSLNSDVMLLRIPSNLVYWMGWSSFHPETELYESETE